MEKYSTRLLCLFYWSPAVKGFAIWAGYSPLNILFFLKCSSFHLLVLAHSRHTGKSAWAFLCFLLVHLGICINFSKSELCLTQHFSFFMTMFIYSGQVYIFTIWQTSWDTAVCSLFVIGATYYCPAGYVHFWKDHLLCQWTCTTLLVGPHHSEWHVECLTFWSSFISFHLPNIASALETVLVSAKSTPFAV